LARSAPTLGPNKKRVLTLKGFAARETLFRVSSYFWVRFPGLSLRSNPGLKLANAFGINAKPELANAFGVTRETFGVIGETFGVTRETFGVIGETFGVTRETFGVICETLGVYR